jgi:peroxiredoxin
MHRLLARLAVSLALSLATAFAAEPAKEKTPGDIAADAFFKARDEARDGKLDGARIQQLQKTGLDFLATYPTHARASGVVTALAGFGSTIKDKKLQPVRDYWNTQLNYEILNRRTKSDATDEVRAVFGSLDAAYAGHLARTAASRENLDTFRTKIDRLAEMEGGARYLPGLERDYIHVLLATSTKLAEAHATKLMASSDKKLAAVGREEMNLIELGLQPLELKFATLDGRGFDATALRGKVLYFVFWSTTNEASLGELAFLKEFYKSYQKLGVEIVTVSQDTDQAAVAKFVKDKGYVWPVLFDGQGSKGEFSERTNSQRLPAGVLFNQKGTLIRTGVKSSQLELEVIKLGIGNKK